MQFQASVRVQAPAGRVWAAMTDWPQHGHWVPLTSVWVVSGPGAGVGTSFVARTAVGPLGFDDPMTVGRWEPPAGDAPGDRPGRCDVEKTGRVVHGRAWFEVVPLADGVSQVTWHEQVSVWPRLLTRPLSPLLSSIGRLLFSRTLRAMAADVQQAPETYWQTRM